MRTDFPTIGNVVTVSNLVRLATLYMTDSDFEIEVGDDTYMPGKWALDVDRIRVETAQQANYWNFSMANDPRIMRLYDLGTLIEQPVDYAVQYTLTNGTKHVERFFRGFVDSASIETRTTIRAGSWFSALNSVRNRRTESSDQARHDPNDRCFDALGSTTAFADSLGQWSPRSRRTIF